MIYRFVEWLLSPLLDIINANQQEALRVIEKSARQEKQHREDMLMEIKLSLSSLPRYDAQLALISERLKELSLNDSAALYETPRLTLGTLMLWEAIAYASEKYEKDIQQHGVTDREAEIFLWAGAYMHENQWAIPDDDTMRTMLALRDNLGTLRTVSKYD